MFHRDVERNVATGTIVAGVAATSALFAFGSLPYEKRVKVVKFLGLLFLALIAGICLMGSFGVLNELPKIPADEKTLAMTAVGVLTLPAFGVLYGFVRFFRK